MDRTHSVSDDAVAASIAHFPSRGGSTAPKSGAARTSTRWRYIALVALLIAVAGAVAWYAFGSAAPTTPVAASLPPLELARVDIATVEPRVLSRSLPLSGSMAPIVQATVKSKVGGEVEQVTVREGEEIKAGEVIARLDTRQLQAQYDRELAAVEKATADRDLATLNRDKNRALLEQRFISQNTYESTESAYAASLASLKLAQAQARLARINLEDAVIRAPFSGMVAERLVEPGEKVSPDSPIVSLVDLRQMVLEAAVPAQEIPSIRVGQKARFKVGGFGDREFEGIVQRINPVTVNGSRAITLYITVENQDRSLKGGMFAQGELVLESSAPVLSIPRSSIREESGVSVVYTLEDGKIGRRQVRVGRAIEGNDFVEVREGLAAGERIIVVDIGDRKPGESVKLAE
jgi:membrane fusion protein (multidrug efflux system)